MSSWVSWRPWLAPPKRLCIVFGREGGCRPHGRTCSGITASWPRMPGGERRWSRPRVIHLPPPGITQRRAGPTGCLRPGPGPVRGGRGLRPRLRSRDPRSLPHDVGTSWWNPAPGTGGASGCDGRTSSRGRWDLTRWNVPAAGAGLATPKLGGPLWSASAASPLRRDTRLRLSGLWPSERRRVEPIAEILEPGAVAKILRSMGLPDSPPRVSPARPPPQMDFDFVQ